MKRGAELVIEEKGNRRTERIKSLFLQNPCTRNEKNSDEREKLFCFPPLFDKTCPPKKDFFPGENNEYFLIPDIDQFLTNGARGMHARLGDERGDEFGRGKIHRFTAFPLPTFPCPTTHLLSLPVIPTLAGAKLQLAHPTRAQTPLSEWIQPYELVALDHDVKGFAGATGQDSELVGAHAADDAAVLDHTLGAHHDSADARHGEGDCAFADEGHGNAEGAQGCDERGVGGGGRGRGAYVNNSEPHSRFRRCRQYGAYDSASAAREDGASVPDKAASYGSNFTPGLFGPLDE